MVDDEGISYYLKNMWKMTVTSLKSNVGQTRQYALHTFHNEVIIITTTTTTTT